MNIIDGVVIVDYPDLMKPPVILRSGIKTDFHQRMVKKLIDAGLRIEFINMETDFKNRSIDEIQDASN